MIFYFLSSKWAPHVALVIHSVYVTQDHGVFSDTCGCFQEVFIANETGSQWLRLGDDGWI